MPEEIKRLLRTCMRDRLPEIRDLANLLLGVPLLTEPAYVRCETRRTNVNQKGRRMASPAEHQPCPGLERSPLGAIVNASGQEARLPSKFLPLGEGNRR